jgi:cyclic pyranopterin phosphate synthase
MTTSNNQNTNQQTANNSAKSLSHLDSDGDIHMVDVSGKTATTREAHATGRVRFPKDIYKEIKAVDGMTKKGSIIQTAHIAGIMAAKRTHDLIPLCHPLPLDKIGLSFTYSDELDAITVTATVKVTHKTGVEMEALTAVSVACLTLYDMTKALSHDIVIEDIRLVTKTGGKSDYQHSSAIVGSI